MSFLSPFFFLGLLVESSFLSVVAAALVSDEVELESVLASFTWAGGGAGAADESGVPDAAAGIAVDAAGAFAPPADGDTTVTPVDAVGVPSVPAGAASDRGTASLAVLPDFPVSTVALPVSPPADSFAISSTFFTTSVALVGF